MQHTPFFNSKNNDLNNLLNIAEFDKTKAKKRFRKSQNKKNLITKVDKKTVNFTKRNFFKFEHVKRKLKVKTKRVKKILSLTKRLQLRKKLLLRKKLSIKLQKIVKNEAKIK